MSANRVDTASNQSRWALALSGLLGILVGVIILARPAASVSVLAIVVAFWALMEGIIAIGYGIALRSVARHWRMILIAGIVSVLFAIVDLYRYPGVTLRLLTVLVGWWLIVSGVVRGAAALGERRVGMPWGWSLLWGVLGIAAGVVTLLDPGMSLLVFMRVLAVFGIAGGLTRLGEAFQVQPIPNDAQRIARHPLRM